MKVDNQDLKALETAIGLLKCQIHRNGNIAFVKLYIITKNRLQELRQRLMKEFTEQEFPEFRKAK